MENVNEVNTSFGLYVAKSTRKITFTFNLVNKRGKRLKRKGKVSYYDFCNQCAGKNNSELCKELPCRDSEHIWLPIIWEKKATNYHYIKN
jgi:hypothetical protein